MNRKISFRGYNLKNKKWLYGYYLVNRGKSYIVQDETADPFSEPEDFEVDPESVGQYVGDYEGKAIFEGDMVKVTDRSNWKCENEGLVIYDTFDCRFSVKCEKEIIPITGEKHIYMFERNLRHEYYCKYEVIGNEYEEKLKISNP